jgi:hypothetical protein
MRTWIVFASIVAATAACSPFDPDLPPTPFQCGPGEGAERCPEGYACNAQNVCEVSRGGPDGAPGVDSGMCGPDQAEPNNMQSQPTQTFVADTRDFIEYAGLSICPAMDADYFFINIPTMGLTNLDVTVTPPAGAITPPSVQITNSTGQPVANGGSDGQGNIKAALNNAAQGQYYAIVTMSGTDTLSSYSILVDTRRP